ncbi:MAG TPA: hypothetical protein VFS92_02900 [Planctomycetota bacterium]|nr:hypothetical protein [Planctomycetota bacterium]
MKTDRGRMVVLGVALLFVVGVLVGAFSVLRGAGGARAPSAGVTPPGTPPAGTPLPIEVTAVPLFPEEEGLEIGKAIREKLAGFSILDGIAAPDAGPYETLLRSATLDARVLNLQPDGYERDPARARMEEDPASFRGDPISAAGELLSLERIPWEGREDPFREIRRGTLRDGKGRLYTFSWPVASPAEEDPVQPGGWVRVLGLLYKTWPVEDAAKPGAKETSLHLVLPRRPQRAYPPLVVKDVDPTWMGQIRDSTPAEMTNFDEDPLFYLLNMTRNLGGAGWEGWLKAKQEAAPEGTRIWPPEDFTGRFRELLDRPDEHRLRPIRYTAFLAKPLEVPPEWVRPNPGNVERLWIGYLVDRDFVPAVWAVAPRSFVDQGLKVDDYISVEGFFYKRVAYQPRGSENFPDIEPRMMQAAVIVAGRITKLDLPEQSISSDVLMVILGLSVLLAVGLLWAVFQGGREEARSLERRKEKSAKRRDAATAGGVPGDLENRSGSGPGPGADAPPTPAPPPPSAPGPPEPRGP